MAIALPNIRRDSTSYNPNKTIGVAFPLDDKNMFFGTLTAKQQAKSNLLNCLLTFPGERLMLPEFGVGLKKLLFEQNIDLNNFPNVEYVSDFSWYIGNYPTLEKEKIDFLIEILNNI